MRFVLLHWLARLFGVRVEVEGRSFGASPPVADTTVHEQNAPPLAPPVQPASDVAEKSV